VPTLIDSNVILDVTTDDADWGDWSAAMLGEAAHENLVSASEDHLPLILQARSVGELP
jgi:hypothetical protein